MRRAVTGDRALRGGLAAAFWVVLGVPGVPAQAPPPAPKPPSATPPAPAPKVDKPAAPATAPAKAPAAKPATAAPTTAAKTASAKTTDGLRWVATFEEAQAIAKKEKKLVLVDFYTDWCGWCRRLDSDVFSKESFQAAASGIVGVKVNAEKHRALADRFGANSYPRLFFLGPDGTMLEQVKGYLGLDDFTAKVKAVKAGDTELARYKEAAADPTNVGGIYRFARFLSDSKQLEQSIPYWQQVHDLALQQVFANPNAAGLAGQHREALYELGRAYASVGLVDVARQRFEEVYSTYPGTPHSAQALLALADLEQKAGRAPQAIAALQRLVNEVPGSPQAQQAAVLIARLQASDAARSPK